MAITGLVIAGLALVALACAPAEQSRRLDLFSPDERVRQFEEPDGENKTGNADERDT